MKTEKLGHWGYKAIVKGTEYAAVSVHAGWGHDYYPQSTWVSTDISHIGDDPLHDFLSESGPLSKIHKAINAPHRKNYRMMFALSRTYGPHIYRPIELKNLALDELAGLVAHENNRAALAKAMEETKDWQSITVSDGSMGVVRLSGTENITIN